MDKNSGFSGAEALFNAGPILFCVWIVRLARIWLIFHILNKNKQKQTMIKKLLLLPGILTLAGLMIPAHAHAATGDIYVSNTPTVVRVGMDGTKVNIPSTILTPSGTVTDAQGNIYVADTLTNSVIKIAPDGSQSTVATGLNAPGALALDGNGNLLVANKGTNSVVKIGAGGTKTTLATGISNPSGLATDANGNLFVSAAGTNSIVKIGSDGTKSNFVTTGLNAPRGLAFDAAGNLLVADSGSDRILSISPTGAKTVKVSTGLDTPSGVGVDSDGNILVADTGSGSIIKIASDGTQTPVVAGLIAPQYLAQTASVHELINIATRGFVATGENVLIGGFIVRAAAGGSLSQTTVVVRAIGPSLSKSGISAPLADPQLELYDSNGKQIATNDDWKDSQQMQIEDSGVAPTNDKESAIYATLPDGRYTAIVRGAGGTTGVALVEVYKIQ